MREKALKMSPFDYPTVSRNSSNAQAEFLIGYILEPDRSGVTTIATSERQLPLCTTFLPI